MLKLGDTLWRYTLESIDCYTIDQVNIKGGYCVIKDCAYGLTFYVIHLKEIGCKGGWFLNEIEAAKMAIEYFKDRIAVIESVIEFKDQPPC